VIKETSKGANRDQAVSIVLLLGAAVFVAAIGLDWLPNGKGVLMLAVLGAFIAGSLLGRVRGRELERADEMKRGLL
jgi:hypothetical protein